ncbi:MAG TPA: ATP-binding cassette domain-containing protein [Cyclobacteriaceae bacterium]|nr:ATP-binding cassette domain-containing protein [Cyclobacteriaceae bacterium]
MKIVAENLGKRFNREWIFRHFSLTVEHGKTYAITGPNGSGKSTLSQVLWGQVPPTAGTLNYVDGENTIPVTDIFKYISIATPYMDLIEEFTLDEAIAFHFKFKKPTGGITVSEVTSRMELAHAHDKKIGAFSSGMKQRLKLALAFYSDTPFLFLDEPTTNLDKTAIEWYLDNLRRQTGRTIVIASNQDGEYPPESIKIDLSAYKKGLQHPTLKV